MHTDHIVRDFNVFDAFKSFFISHGAHMYVIIRTHLVAFYVKLREEIIIKCHPF